MIGFIELARRRRAGELSGILGVHARAASQNGKAINALKRKLDEVSQ